MCGVDHLRICGSPIPSKLAEQLFPDAAPSPANKPVIDRGRGTIFGRAIAPAAPALQHMHDATDNAPIVCTLDASHIRRQTRLNPLPLLIAQPKQVLPHGPDPPKRIRYTWNQDCFATAAKLMSSHPSPCVRGMAARAHRPRACRRNDIANFRANTQCCDVLATRAPEIMTAPRHLARRLRDQVQQSKEIAYVLGSSAAVVCSSESVECCSLREQSLKDFRSNNTGREYGGQG